ncbi:MAG: hypothetical protein AAF335_03375, partial [Bacteroidota bacterium]
MKKYGLAFIGFFCNTVTSSLIAAQYFSYEDVANKKKDSFLKTYLEDSQPKIEQLIRNVILSCKIPHIQVEEEVNKIDEPYFYEVLLIPIFRNKQLFEAPNYPINLKNVTDHHRYALIQVLAKAMKTYAEEHYPRQKEQAYDVLQPPIPWQYTEKEGKEWKDTIKDHFTKSYDLSKEIYQDFSSQEKSYKKSGLSAAQAASIGTGALFTAYMLGNWQQAKKINKKKEEIKKEEIKKEEIKKEEIKKEEIKKEEIKKEE